jgi:hypothetical protein
VLATQAASFFNEQTVAQTRRRVAAHLGDLQLVEKHDEKRWE